MIKVIGFAGKMGVGKSTAVEYLKTAHPDQYVSVRFAGVLYELQNTIYARIQDAYKPEKTPIKDRKLLQWLGTEWGRSLSPTLWVDLWRMETCRRIGAGLTVLVEDVRFDNEAAAIRGLGGVVVEITGSSSGRDVVRGGIEGHASEGGIDPKLVDIIIENAGTKETFNQQLEDLMETIK